MGLFGNLFGSKPEAPPLDPASEAAQRIERHRARLEPLVAKIKDRVEIVPGEAAVFAFVGKPPGTFGIAWVDATEEHNLKTLIQAHQLPASAVQRVTEALRASYERHMKEQRRSATVAGQLVTVTDSPAFARELGEIIERVAR